MDRGNGRTIDGTNTAQVEAQALIFLHNTAGRVAQAGCISGCPALCGSWPASVVGSGGVVHDIE